MKTRFCIINYYDPYGDGKSTKKELQRVGFESNKTLMEVAAILKKYNSRVGYYEQVSLIGVDGRIKHFKDFDKHYYSKTKQ